MNFADRITRSPRPYEVERGKEIAILFADLPGDVREVLIGAGGSSPFLKGLMERDADWLREVLAEAPELSLDRVLAEVSALEPTALAAGLRLAKRRVALLTALCDLGGVWPLGTVTGALTRLADLAVDRAVKTLVAAEIDRGKLPEMGEADKASAAGMSVLAMGKMGAGE
ncbi:MAG: glutamine-synthetase adenylyltransferase, partial [Paracoccaceae bacterium]